MSISTKSLRTVIPLPSQANIQRLLTLRQRGGAIRQATHSQLCNKSRQNQTSDNAHVIPALSYLLPRRHMQILQPNEHELDCCCQCLPISSWHGRCTSSFHTEGRWHPGKGVGRSATCWSYPMETRPQNFQAYPGLPWGNRGLDFETLLVLWRSFIEHLLYADPCRRPWEYGWERGLETRPRGTYRFKAFPGVAQKRSCRVPWFGSKSAEVRA